MLCGDIWTGPGERKSPPEGEEERGFSFSRVPFPLSLFSVDFRFFLDMFNACGASEFLRRETRGKMQKSCALLLLPGIVLFLFLGFSRQLCRY